MPGKPVSDEDVRKIEYFHAEGRSIPWIAEKLGRDYKTVQRRVKALTSTKSTSGKSTTRSNGSRPRTAAKRQKRPVLAATPEPVLVEESDSGAAEFISTVGEALSLAQANPREVTIQLDDAAGKFVRDCADAFILSDEAVVRTIFERGLARTREIFQ